MLLNVKFLQILFIIFISFESINSGDSNKIIIIFLILKTNFLMLKHSYHFQQFLQCQKSEQLVDNFSPLNSSCSGSVVTFYVTIYRLPVQTRFEAKLFLF